MLGLPSLGQLDRGLAVRIYLATAPADAPIGPNWATGELDSYTRVPAVRMCLCSLMPVQASSRRIAPTRSM